MTFTVTTIAEKVEIDYNSENPGDTVKHTGNKVVVLSDNNGNRHAIDADGLSVGIGDTVELVIR